MPAASNVIYCSPQASGQWLLLSNDDLATEGGIGFCTTLLPVMDCYIYKSYCSSSIQWNSRESATAKRGYITGYQLVYSSCCSREELKGQEVRAVTALMRGACTHFLCRMWPVLTLHCPPGVLPGLYHLVSNLNFLCAPHHSERQMALKENHHVYNEKCTWEFCGVVK